MTLVFENWTRRRNWEWLKWLVIDDFNLMFVLLWMLTFGCNRWMDWRGGWMDWRGGWMKCGEEMWMWWLNCNLQCIFEIMCKWVHGWIDWWISERTDEWTDGRTDGWMDGRSDGWMDGRMDGWWGGTSGWKAWKIFCKSKERPLCRCQIFSKEIPDMIKRRFV